MYSVDIQNCLQNNTFSNKDMLIYRLDIFTKVLYYTMLVYFGWNNVELELHKKLIFNDNPIMYLLWFIYKKGNLVYNVEPWSFDEDNTWDGTLASEILHVTIKITFG